MQNSNASHTSVTFFGLGETHAEAPWFNTAGSPVGIQLSDIGSSGPCLLSGLELDA